MSDAEQLIAAWASAASPEALRAGPTADDLGGIQVLAARALELATGPFLPFLVQVAARQHHDASSEASTASLAAAVVAGIAEQARHSAFASATDLLNAQSDFTVRLGRPLAQALARRIRAGLHSTGPADAFIAAEAAECLLQMALIGATTPWELLSILEEATEYPDRLPEALAARLPRILGVLDQMHPAAGLRGALERLLAFDYTHADAAFELAMSDLRHAFDSAGPGQLTTRLVQVRSRLAGLWENVDARHDAGVYLAAIDAVLAFGGPSTRQQVTSAARALRGRAGQYAAWLNGTPLLPWSQPRQHEITAWTETIMILQAAATHLDDHSTWLNPPQALHALLRAYTAGRGLPQPAAEITRALIPPAVEATFLRHEDRRRILQSALTELPEFRDNPTARLLSQALHEGDGDPGSGITDSGDAWGKARRWPHIASVISSGKLSAFLADTQDHADTLDQIELGLRTQCDVEAAIADPKRARLMEKLFKELSTSPDWVPDIAESFRVLLDHTVSFAFQCYDNGRQMGGSYTEYLRSRDPAGRRRKVDERQFHQHYLQCLNFSSLASIVKAEVINTGGGRADLVASFGPVQFPVECKIEEEDASEDNLRKYAGQAAQYTVTRTTFAILLVLDLTDHDEGTADIYSSMWIEHVRRPHEHDDRHIVTIRIPGGRIDPSSVETPARHKMPVTA